jgi:hypothetical protein
MKYKLCEECPIDYDCCYFETREDGKYCTMGYSQQELVDSDKDDE